MNRAHALTVDDKDSETKPRQNLFQRFAKFSVVGAGGVTVQTVTLAVLLRVSGMHYLAATAIAVEASVRAPGRAHLLGSESLLLARQGE